MHLFCFYVILSHVVVNQGNNFKVIVSAGGQIWKRQSSGCRRFLKKVILLSGMFSYYEVSVFDLTPFNTLIERGFKKLYKYYFSKADINIEIGSKH